MKNNNKIIMKLYDGWFEQLISEIEYNSKFPEILLDHPEEFDNDIIFNAITMYERNKWVLQNLKRKRSNENVYISPVYYEAILYILLENSAVRNKDDDQDDSE